MVSVIKKDGKIVGFDIKKIAENIIKAAKDSNTDISHFKLIEIELKVINELGELNKELITTGEIDLAVNKILGKNYKEILKAYKKKSKQRDKVRTKNSDLMKNIAKLGIMTDRDNANVGSNFSAKLLRIASESNKSFNLSYIPEEIAEAHENGDVYAHDLDSFNLTTNCLHIPAKDKLASGFNTGYGNIRPPKRLESATELLCILMQSSQNDCFGGQSFANLDNDLVPYLQMTRREIEEEYAKIMNPGTELYKQATEEKLIKTTHQSMQGICFNLNTLHSRAGSQVPFSSINIGLPESEDAALICQIFLEEYEKGFGKGEQFIFPNIIFRVKDGVNKKEGDPYHYLFDLACRVASKRMNPTFMNIDADFNKAYYDKGYVPATMGCRTYLMGNCNGEPGVEGRGNIAPATINLPRVGILANRDIDKFFEILNERMELAKDNLLFRYDTLKMLKVRDLPFSAGEGLMRGSEGLEEEDSIEPILRQGTWGIGFIGLAETLAALTGCNHAESEEARELGLKIISFMREKTDSYVKKYKLNFSTYATPAEGLSGKFVIQDKLLFGEIKGVTDKQYYTNSFHVPVSEKISIIDKINIEAPYHKLCNGGHITYIEVDGYPDKDTVKDIIKYAYSTNINYIGINFHIRYCKKCGEMINQSATTCHKCGSMKIQGISRVTGYLSLDERFGEGKRAEREDRVAHGKH